MIAFKEASRRDEAFDRELASSSFNSNPSRTPAYPSNPVAQVYTFPDAVAITTWRYPTATSTALSPSSAS